MKRLKGINRDVGEIDQPQGTYRDARNAIVSERLGALSSEGGAVSKDSVPTNMEVLGDTLVYDGRHIMFLVGLAGTAAEGQSEIGVFDGTSYTTIVSDSSLSFQPGSVIEAVNIINDRDEVVVYWTDDINPPRFYNIDDPSSITDIDTLNIFPTIDKAPYITLDSVNSTGGQLETGAYHFAIALYTEDKSRTNYMSVTPPVYINEDSDPADHDVFDGAPAGTPTSKSIQLNIANIDENYRNFEIVVIRKANDTVAEVVKLPQQRISSESTTFSYGGTEETTSSSLDEVIINTAAYETAKTILEQDDTLYMGNLSKKADIGYQRYANNITVESVVTDIDDGGSGLLERDHYGNPMVSFYDKSFKRGDVYAFYISFVLENGQDSQAYHIPGRESEGTEKDTFIFGHDFYLLRGFNGTNGMGFWENVSENYPDNDQFDIYDVDASGDPVDTGNTLRNTPVRHHRFPDAYYSGMSFWDGTNNDSYGKKLGIKLSNIKIPSSIIDRVRGVKISYAKRTLSNQIVLDQGIGFPLKIELSRTPANKDDRALMYTMGSSARNPSQGLYFQAFNSLRTRKNIGSASYFREVGQPTGPTFSDGDGDNDQVFFDMSEKMYYDNGPVYPIKAISYLDAGAYVSGISNGFSYNIDNTLGEEAIAIQAGNSYVVAWDGVGEPWGERSEVEGQAEGYVGRVFELIQVLNNAYVPFDQQELVWTGIQLNDIDVFDPRVTIGTSGSAASGSLDITGDSKTVAPYPEAVLTFDATKPAEGHIEITANNLTPTSGEGHIDVSANGLASSATEDHTISVGGDSTAAITINDTDTTEQIVDKYIAEFNNTAALTADYSVAKSDQGGGTWRLEITGTLGDESLNSEVVDVTGDTDVTTATSDISGADDGEEDHTVSVDGNSASAVTIVDTDTPEQIVTKYRDAINGDATISADWTATIDDASGEWRTIITSDAESSTWNGKTIDVTGETDVVLTTANSSGGQSTASAGDIDITFAAPHGTFTITTTLSGGETSDQVATAVQAALDSEPVFTYGFETTLDTSPVNPTLTITAVSNGSYFNTTITLDATTTDVVFTKDGDIDGGVDTGALDDRFPIGFIDIGVVVTTGDLVIEFPSPLLSSTTVAIDNSDSTAVTAQKIKNALDANTNLNDLTFFVYEDRCYYWKPNDFIYDGVQPSINDTLSTGEVAALVSAIENARVGDGDPGSVKVIISTPIFNGSLNISITPGDNAGTVESKVSTGLQNWAAFNNYYTVSGPIFIDADANGSSYNGTIGFDPKGTGVTYTVVDLTGGVDGSGDSIIEEVYGGDTYINFYGTKASIWNWYGSGGEARRHLAWFPCESQDNIKLRHSGDSEAQVYYPKTPYRDILRLEADASSEIKQGRDDQQYTLDNYIAYNPDYSSQAVLKAPIPAGKSLDVITKFSTRVIRSAEGDQTQGDKGIRTFLENDYIDLTRSRGELTKLVVMQNTILPHMRRSLIRTKGREELVTGDFRAYLGSGDIFSAKPDEIISTREGFAGLQDPRCAIVTPGGYFFVDRQAGEVILMGQEGPEIISENGLNQFFKDELKEAADNKLICSYDNDEDRILLTYKGEWTLSYYPALKSWVSFHDYDPDYYLYDLKTFYTLKNDEIHSHNIHTVPGTFYGTTYSFIFDFVANPQPELTKLFFNILYIAEVENASGVRDWDKTFDQFRVYNDKFDSGVTNIQVLSSLGDGSNARNVEGTWKINQFRDMLVSGSVDPSKPWQQQGKFIDKWIRVRLIFNNSNQDSIYLYSSNVSARPSTR